MNSAFFCIICMLMAEKEKVGRQEVWPQRQFSELQGKTGVPLIFVVIYSIAQLIRGNHSGWMLLGLSIISFVAIFGYAIASYLYGATGRRSYFAMLLALGGFIPYFFGIYLLAYHGLYGLYTLLQDFMFWHLLKDLLFIWAGYSLVANFYQITQLSNQVSEDYKANH